MRILIGGAWPYANGSLHIGHIAALLPGDILARYFRLKGHEVCYVSGSDCHGTPIQLRAQKDGVSPLSITEHYHNEFTDSFEKLGFSYDLYNSTYDSYHIDFVQEFFKKLLEGEYVYKKTIEQTFCSHCNQFLPDRYVIGLCPHCGNRAKGDQCDHCGAILDTSSLLERQCSICGTTPILKPTEHFFLALSKLDEFVKKYVESAKGWRANALRLTQRYINEGLRDRAITRDLEWGIPVPIEGLEDKKIYVWVEAVLGYLSASKKWLEENQFETSKKQIGDNRFEVTREASLDNNNSNWDDFWTRDSVHYYIHGKDNIPFHTIILPALLKAHGNLHLPDKIISSEYVTLEGRKISTSQNWAIWIPYLLEKYDPDSIRYFFTANAPEKRDIDFSWREFINNHNGELLGAYGNFVNRSFVFIQRSFEGYIPKGCCSIEVKDLLCGLYDKTGTLIEEGSFKEALDEIFALIRFANKYFDQEKPWITVKENIEKCADTLHTCIQIIANLSILLEPFLPFSSKKIRSTLPIDEFCTDSSSWKYQEVKAGEALGKFELLFERIDKKVIDDEVAKLTNK